MDLGDGLGSCYNSDKVIDKNVCEQPIWVTAWHIQDSAEVVTLLKPVDFYFACNSVNYKPGFMV